MYLRRTVAALLAFAASLVLAMPSVMADEEAKDAPVSNAGKSRRTVDPPVSTADYQAMRSAFQEIIRDQDVRDRLIAASTHQCAGYRLVISGDQQLRNTVLVDLAFNAAVVDYAANNGLGGSEWSAILEEFEADTIALAAKGKSKLGAGYHRSIKYFVRELFSDLTTSQRKEMNGIAEYVLHCAGHPDHMYLDRVFGFGFSGPLKGFGSRKGSSPREYFFVLAAEPQGAAIRLITRWNKLVCEGQGIDPHDFDKCRGWRDLADGSRMLLMGDYHYSVAWDDGTARNGFLSFHESDGEKRVVLTPNGPVYP